MLTALISGRGDWDARAYSSLDLSVDGDLSDRSSRNLERGSSSVDDEDEENFGLGLDCQMFWSPPPLSFVWL